MIVTHRNPDLDAIVSVWLLKRFGGMEQSPVRFVSFGEAIPPDVAGATFVDIGGGQLDHHGRDDFVSAATLTLDMCACAHDPVLRRLCDIARKVDHGIFDSETEGELNLIAIIGGLNECLPDRPDLVMETGLSCLDGAYRAAQSNLACENELRRGVHFNTRWGPGIAISCEHAGAVRRYCHRKGIVIVVYIDTETRFRGIASCGGRGVDLSDVYREVTQMELEAEWYLHFTKDYLICGSQKALNRRLSTLSLDTLVTLVRIQNEEKAEDQT